MVLSFFGFNESNLYKIYNSIFYLVKWGFSRNDLFGMPIPEYEEYIKNLNNYYKEKNKAIEKMNEGHSVPSSGKGKNTYGNIKN